MWLYCSPPGASGRGLFYISIHVRCEIWPSLNSQLLKVMHYFAVHFYWRFSISTRAKHDFDRRNRFSSILNLTDDVLSYMDLLKCISKKRLVSNQACDHYQVIFCLLFERIGSFCFCTRIEFIQWILWLSCVAHTKCHSLTSHWPWGITVQ